MANPLFSRWNGAATGSSQSNVKYFKYFLVTLDEITNYHKNKYFLPIKLTEKSLDELYLDDTLPINNKNIRICCISDTHENHESLGMMPKCDFLIHSGDILMRSRLLSIEEGKYRLKLFNEWIGKQPAKHKVIIPGNHDIVIEKLEIEEINKILFNANYLCNNSIELQGIKICGIPLSEGNSNNRAFQSDEFKKKASDIINKLENEKIDVLITHGSCKSVGQRLKPRIAHISGHYHQDHGVKPVLDGLYWSDISQSWLSIAAPIMDAEYKPTQFPIVMDLEINQ